MAGSTLSLISRTTVILADAQLDRSFAQVQFASFGTFAFAINRDSSLSSEVTYPELSPCVALCRSHTDPVQDRRDAGIRQKASEFFNETFCRRTGLPTMLPCTTLRYLKSGVIAAFPMKLESETARLGLDDHLFEDCAQDPFARFDGGPGVVPRARQVVGQRDQRFRSFRIQ